jgi:helicase MOV-10
VKHPVKARRFPCRSHPDILHIPSEIFYHGELDACADEEARESLCQWGELPTRGFPIIFHGLAAPDDRDGNSPSWYNEGEIRQVIIPNDKKVTKPDFGLSSGRSPGTGFS